LDIEKLLELLEPTIRHKSNRASLAGYDAEDVAQELRIEVWKKYDHFLNGKSSIKTFANLVFNNRIRNIYKSKHCRNQADTYYNSSL